MLLDGLNAAFGMARVGTDRYVANTDAILRVADTKGVTRITAPGVVVAKLPARPINHHWTKNLVASADGRKLHVTVGSNSNVAKSGMAVEAEGAAIWEVDLATGTHRVYASGLRNPNGMAWAPGGDLWTVVYERDEIGSDLVPDGALGPHSGYRVVFVPFDGSRPCGAPPLDVLTGFLDGEGHAFGRPVGVAAERHGCLLVADDVGNAVWRVTATP